MTDNKLKIFGRRTDRLQSDQQSRARPAALTSDEKRRQIFQLVATAQLRAQGLDRRPTDEEIGAVERAGIPELFDPAFITARIVDDPMHAADWRTIGQGLERHRRSLEAEKPQHEGNDK